jgi:hypothetical protein
MLNIRSPFAGINLKPQMIFKLFSLPFSSFYSFILSMTSLSYWHALDPLAQLSWTAQFQALFPGQEFQLHTFIVFLRRQHILYCTDDAALYSKLPQAQRIHLWYNCFLSTWSVRHDSMFAYCQLHNVFLDLTYPEFIEARAATFTVSLAQTTE